MTVPAAPDETVRTDWRALAWVMLPVMAVLVARALLQAQADEATASLQRLAPATLVSSPGEAFWAASKPFVYALGGAALGLVVLVMGWRAALRRHGWPRVRPWVLGAWLLLCAGAAAALVVSQLNRSGRQPLPEQTAKVLLVRAVPPSQRGPGGAELYLDVPGEATPLELLTEDHPATALPPGTAVRLQAEAGRWWGRWARVAPAVADTPASPPAGSPGG